MSRFVVGLVVDAGMCMSGRVMIVDNWPDCSFLWWPDSSGGRAGGRAGGGAGGGAGRRGRLCPVTGGREEECLQGGQGLQAPQGGLGEGE